MAKQKKKKTPETTVDLNMTPMIDVTFQLLIFFIVTMKFRLLEKKLLSHLPTDLGLNNSTDIIEENFVTVKLRQMRDKTGRKLNEQTTEFFIENRVIRGSSRADIYSQIQTEIARVRNQMADARGKIDAGRGVPHEEVVSVLDLFHKTGFESISFVGISATKNLRDGNNLWTQRKNELNAKVQ